MNFKNHLMTWLLAGSMFAALDGHAQAPSDNSKPDEPKAKTEFKQNADHALINLNPAFREKLESILPFDDTTRAFYPSMRETRTGYSTPREERHIDAQNETITDKVSLVRETISANRFGIGKTEEERPEGVGAIFSVIVSQRYHKEKDGRTNTDGGYSTDERNSLEFFINQKDGIRVVKLTSSEINVKDYKLSPEDHGIAVMRIADGSLSPMEEALFGKKFEVKEEKIGEEIGRENGGLWDNDYKGEVKVKEIKNDQKQDIRSFMKFGP